MTFREYLETKIFNLTDRDTLPYEEIANDILKEIEKRIDSVGYPYDTEWYCQLKMDELKNDLKKEILK